MHRTLGSLAVGLLVGSVCGLSAAGPPCGKGQHEIAFTHPDTKGAFADASYRNRKLIPNVPVCSDSSVVHVKDGKHSLDDQLVLRGLFGDRFPPFRCGDTLNCSSPNQLIEKIRAATAPRLAGKSLWESVTEFRRAVKSRQTSTLPRGLGYRALRAEIVPAGADVTGSVLGAGDPSGKKFDICLHADRADCGDTLPNPIALPIRKLPPGLHIVWEARPLKGDKVPLRLEDTALYLVGAHTSWTAKDVAGARAYWSALVTAPGFDASGAEPALREFARRLSQPRP